MWTNPVHLANIMSCSEKCALFLRNLLCYLSYENLKKKRYPQFLSVLLPPPLLPKKRKKRLSDNASFSQPWKGKFCPFHSCLICIILQHNLTDVLRVRFPNKYFILSPKLCRLQVAFCFDPYKKRLLVGLSPCRRWKKTVIITYFSTLWYADHPMINSWPWFVTRQH